MSKDDILRRTTRQFAADAVKRERATRSAVAAIEDTQLSTVTVRGHTVYYCRGHTRRHLTRERPRSNFKSRGVTRHIE